MMKGVLCYAVGVAEGVTVQRVLAVLMALAALVLLPSPAFAQPAATSMLPVNGDAAGNYLTVINGSGFASGATVRFGSTLSTNVTVAGTTTIIATVPPGVAGTAHTVIITNPDGLAVAVPVQFRYDGVPLSVTSVSPSTGSSFGGTLVAVSGSGFLPGAIVLFGTTLGNSVSVTSPTLLTVVAPAGTVGSSVSVTVTNTNGVSAGAQSSYTFGNSTVTTSSGLQPTVSSVSPNSGSAAGGTIVTIQGAGFLPGASVSFNGTLATNVAVLSSAQISATAPSGVVGPAALMVTNPGGIFGGISNGFTYLTATLQVTAVSPAEGVLAGGTPILLTGSGFVVGATVTIGGQPARNVVVTSGTQISAITPGGSPGPATILVTNPGGLITGLANGFTFSATAVIPPTPPPSTGAGIAITSVSPTSGLVGSATLVTITGQGFLAGAIVTIGGLPATNVTVISSTQILASAPTGASAGSALVVVSNAGGAGAALPNGFTFTAAGSPTPPTPPVVPPSGGTLPPGSSGLMVFGGGSNAALVAASGCSASRVVLWATNAQGQWVGYIPTAPAIINLSWDALFPNGLAAGTPIYVRCS